ncbi:MAG: hypothetical protein AAGJ96_06910 [Pseudomonadota bacterium]
MFNRRTMLGASVSCISCVALAGGVRADALPQRGTYDGTGIADGMILIIRRDGARLMGTFIDPRGQEAAFELDIDDQEIASGLVRVGRRPLVMTLELLNSNVMAMGTVPLDENYQPVMNAARGFEFIRR